MSFKYFLVVLFLLLATGLAGAVEDSASSDDKQAAPEETKELAGMSIVGNDEAPKSLYIVPWKSSELGAEASMNMMLNERDVPIDRDVFMRQLEYYEISTTRAGGQP